MARATEAEKKTMEKMGYTLKSRDVAHILDVSPDEVIEMARRGSVRAKKQGRFWRFRYTDVVAYQKKTMGFA